MSETDLPTPGDESVQEGADDNAAPSDAVKPAPLQDEASAQHNGSSAEGEGAELQRQLDVRNDQYLRLSADFENFRRRKAQELVDARRYASEDAVRALLPVLDNLQRALATVPPDTEDDALIAGVRLVARDFEAAFERLGVSAVDAVGATFDPSQHEAVAAEDSAEVDHETVISEYQRGYRLHDRVLRPAMVRIAHPVR